jgi:hypothetical protein
LEEKNPPLTEKIWEKIFFPPRCCCCTGAPRIANNKNYRRSTANRRENRLDLEAMAKPKGAKWGRRSYDCAVMAWQMSWLDTPVGCTFIHEVPNWSHPSFQVSI